MQFIPDFIPKNYKSKAEITIFNKLHQLTEFEDWTCLHSLSISHHMTKRESEIDFLFLSSSGLFVLEIKGGRINRHLGKWQFIDHLNRVHKGQSPFEQAKTSLYSLQHQIGKVIHPHHVIRNSVFGYGVAFPDIEFNIESAEWDQDIVCDKRDLNNLGQYLNRLVNYWQRASRSSGKLSEHNVASILQYLRGDFISGSHNLNYYITESEREIMQLTSDQMSVLDMASNNPRISIIGGAGTGKTMLALKMFKHVCQKNKRVLFLCYNKLLAQSLNDQMSDYISDDHVIDSLHNFMFKYMDLPKGYVDQHSDKHDLFSNKFPKKFLEIVKDFKKFDFLIIDEGQDILFSQYIAVLDSLLKDGLDDGNWLMCMDENQNIYRGDVRQTMTKIKQKSAVLELKVNCRNTDHIIDETKKITGINIASKKIAHGQTVEHIWCHNEANKIKQLELKLESLLKDGIKPQDITILTPYRQSLEVLGNLKINQPIYNLSSRQMLNDVHQSAAEDAIQCSTIAAYKGLENKVVILLDLRDFTLEKYKMLYYVGLTRARVLLILIMDKSLKPAYLSLGQLD